MTRRIALELGPQTTDTECRNCPRLGPEPPGPMSSGYPICRIWHGFVDWPPKRLPECIAAELAGEGEG
jgi:hypothetical protein